MLSTKFKFLLLSTTLFREGKKVLNVELTISKISFILKLQ